MRAQYWVENGFHDFDHGLATQLIDFIDEELMKNEQWRDSLARRLRSAVLECVRLEVRLKTVKNVLG